MPIITTYEYIITHLALHVCIHTLQVNWPLKIYLHCAYIYVYLVLSQQIIILKNAPQNSSLSEVIVTHLGSWHVTSWKLHVNVSALSTPTNPIDSCYRKYLLPAADTLALEHCLNNVHQINTLQYMYATVGIHDGATNLEVPLRSRLSHSCEYMWKVLHKSEKQ